MLDLVISHMDGGREKESGTETGREMEEQKVSHMESPSECSTAHKQYLDSTSWCKALIILKHLFLSSLSCLRWSLVVVCQESISKSFVTPDKKKTFSALMKSQFPSIWKNQNMCKL